MKKLLVATHNLHKKEEIQQMLEGIFHVESLLDHGLLDEIVEDGDSFMANAQIKADYCFEKTGISSLGDDSGLVVSALDGRPGIHSARYASDHDFEKNIERVLQEMEGEKNREAYFITQLCYKTSEGTYFFEGRVYGDLLEANKGTKGFGYDPIFVPKGYDKTFAEMTPEEKNKISHRREALNKFLEFLG